MSRRRSPGAFRVVICVAFAALMTVVSSSAWWRDGLAPGGFIESADGTALRTKPSAGEIAAFLPSERGTFSFPVPYGTQGYRLTTEADCAGTDCVQPFGHSFWRNLNNSTGSDTLYAFAALEGHGGPTLFSINKITGAVANLGPLFGNGDPHAGDTAEDYYFSATAATTLYVPETTALRRYDILAHTFSTVLDIESANAQATLGIDRQAEGFSSSQDDLVHAFSTSSADEGLLGCAVYHESTGQFTFIPGTPEYSGCLIDKSGQFLALAEGSDLRSVDLQTGTERIFPRVRTFRRGYDTGYGYVLVEDSRDDSDPAVIRRWFLDRPATDPGQGLIVTHMAPGADTYLQPTHGNARPGDPTSQYACQSGLRGPGSDPAPRDGDLVCFPLDGSERVLVVAPAMADLARPGGPSEDSRIARPSLDPTGEFMIWTSNASGRLDAFVARVPAWRLGNTPPPDTTPPTVTITAPANTATVAGSVGIQATADDDAGLVGVQFLVDGSVVAPQLITPPFAIAWNTTGVADGVHTLTAVASDRYGNDTTSDPILVTVMNTPAPPTISKVGYLSYSDTSVLVNWTTNQLADSKVNYGATLSYTHSTSLDGARVVTHGQLVSGLQPATTYHFAVTSRNSLGLSASSTDLTFTTPSVNMPELPRTFVDTTFALPTGGSTVTVNADGDFQAALDAANPGDVIVLEAGATFSGNFELPNKTGAGWIYVISSALANLPGPGSRVQPADSALMPKLVSPNVAPVLSTLAGAHHYRFTGIEIATSFASTTATHFQIIDLQAPNPSSADDAPHHLTFDRCYVHGTATGNIRRAFAMNSESTAVIDSYIDEIHEIGGDSQAIAVWNGAGPFKIVNNALSAAGENVLIGGNDPAVPFLVPSDIEIRGNYVWKPLIWKDDDPSYAGIRWTVKNLMEFKNAQRVLVEGNVFENSWASGQSGFAVLFTARNQGGEAPWSVVQDMTYRRNIIRHAGGGVTVAGTDNESSSLRTARILIRDNLFEDIKEAWGHGWGFGVNLTATENMPVVGVNHLTIDHNTIFSDAAYVFTDSGDDITKAQDNFVFRNNIVNSGPFGFSGSGTGNGRSTLDAYYLSPIFLANAIIDGSDADLIGYPGNLFPVNIGAVGFVDAATGNYALSPGSSLHNAATDGLDIGANMPVVATATATAVSGLGSGSAPAISDVSASAITGSTATITWTTDLPADSQVEYGETPAYGLGTPMDAATVTAHGIQLTGLAAGTTYHFRVHSTNATSWTSTSVDITFATAAPPMVSAVAASAITGTAAIINWTTDLAATSQLEYGLTTAYGSTTTFDAALVTTHAQSLAALAIGSTYHYRVTSTSSLGLTTTSEDVTFTTVAVPIASAVAATAITGTSATIAWTTDQPATSQVEYGLTSDYGSATTLSEALVTAHSQGLTGLGIGSTYHYRVISTNSVGLTTASTDLTFTAVNVPVLSSVSASAVTGTTATISWASDQAATSRVEYGTTTAYGSSTSLDSALTTSHSQGLSGLAIGTTYHFRVISTNSVGLMTTSEDATFVTVAAPVVSAVAASAITGTATTISWTSDQPTSSQVEYGTTTAYGSSTSLDSALTTAHSQALSGLVIGTTYHFRVLSTNSVGLTRTSNDFTFTTVALPIVSAVSASAITGITATINWSTDQTASSQVEYGPTTAYGATTTLDPAFVTVHLQNLTGLTVNTTYHYRVISTNAAGLTTTSADFSFVTGVGAVISSVSATGITGSAAAIGWNTDQPANSLVEYGTTTNYGSASPLNSSLVNTHSVTLSGLTHGTAYHYRVISTNLIGLTTTSDDFTFTTVAKAVIADVSASNITGTTATITWTTDQPANTQVEYGTNTLYGALTTPNPALITGHSQTLTGLIVGTVYHYRVRSTNAVGLQTIVGDFTFTTIAAPVISLVTTSNITGTSATIAWTTNQLASSTVEYGPTSAYGFSTTLDATLVTSHTQTLSGLANATTYHFRVTSTNDVGLVSTSGDFTFTTVAAPVVSAVSAAAITGTAATITWTTDQPTSSQVEYGTTTAYGSATTLDSALATSHSQALSGLAIGTTYHLRVISTNSVGLTTMSEDVTFTTVAAPVVSAVAAAAVTGAAATISWTSDQLASSQIEYGTTTAYGTTTPLDPALATSHSQTLIGLTIATTCHFRVVSTNNVGLTTRSEDVTFTTVALPVVSGIAVSAISGTTATIGWATDQPASSQVEYGPTTSYGATTTFNSTPVTAHLQGLAGLTIGTTYHCRVISTNSVGLTTTSEDLTFTTVAAPVVSAVAAAAITGTAATITWTSDQLTSSQVEYGTTTAYGGATSLDSALATSHSQALSGLVIGTTYHFRVISTSSVGLTTTSEDLTFTTVALPIVSGIAASAITGTTATIGWTTDQPAASQVEYGPTISYGITTTLSSALVTSHVQGLTGLTIGTMYHFRVTSTNSVGLTTTSGDATFTTVAAPIVSGIAASAISGTTATIGWTTDQPGTSQIEYGLTSAYGTATTLNTALVTTHAQTLAGLTIGTTYHFRVTSTNGVGLTTTSEDVTFTTVAAPVLSNLGTSAITGTTATINWTTDQATTSQVEYGLSTDYSGTTTLDPALATAHGQTLTGLQPGTTYHYRVISTNAVGLTTSSSDGTFPTVARPVVASVVASAVTGTSATIAWTSDQPATSQVEYGPTTTYGNTTALDLALSTSHSQNLTNLTPGTTYHYRVISTNSVGLTDASVDATFSTVAVPLISLAAASSVTGTSATITWQTDQQTTSQVEYGQSTNYGNDSGVDASLVTSHSVSIAGLTPGHTYHFRVRSSNGVGLVATSNDVAFTTVAIPNIAAASASAITGTGATILWTTDQASSSRVEYGLTTSYGSGTALDPALVTSHSQTLVELTPSTTYHYRVISTNSVGLNVTSDDATFTTVAPPIVSFVTALGATATSVTITWLTNQPADSQVEFGLTTAYGSATSADATASTSHAQLVTGLTPGETYHFRVRSTNSVGLTTVSPDDSFSMTPQPIVSGVGVTGITGTVATISWTTDQPTDAQVEFGLTTAYGSGTSLDAASTTTHSQTLSGLVPGTRYHFRVRSTNAVGLTALSGDDTFITVAVPVISAVNVSGITGTSATIDWSTDQATTSQVEYGPTTNYGLTTTHDAARVTSHSQTLSSLAIGTAYHYRVTSTNAVGMTVTSSDGIFSTVPAPVISDVLVTAITGTTATVGWATDQNTSSQVEYGPTTSYGTTTTLDSALVVAHLQTLNGLTPGTAYHYRVHSANVHGMVTTSADDVFTTVAPPLLSGIAAGSVTLTSAGITWISNQPADSQVEYGTTTAYGAVTTLVPALTTSHAVALVGLTNGTTYHYRVRSANAVGLVSHSNDATFTTLAPVVISGLDATSVGRSSASIVWTTNQPADSTLEYGPTTSYGTTVPDPTLVAAHAVAFSGLTASTTYHYRVTSKNTFGLTSTSSDGTFTTAAAAEDSNVTLSITKAGTGAGIVLGPNGINCGPTCSAQINPDVPVTLTAVASAGSTFVGWSGACAGTQPACTISLTATAAVTASFSSATPGDFDGDGFADLVLRHDDGTLALWRMQGTTLLSSTYITTRDRSGTSSTGPVLTSDSRVVDPNWQIVATPDLDGNGKADLLWQNVATGQVTAWIMEVAVKVRSEPLSPASIDPAWQLQAAADFNGDGHPDLLWHQDGTNQLNVWLMDGTTRVSELAPQPTSVPVDWRLVGSADFDRDGQLDLVWQNQTTGDTFLWYMNGTTLRVEEAIGRFGAGWQARAVADFDLDGHPDIIWQKSTGELAAWFMNGATVIRTAALSPGAVQPAWRIVGAR